MAHEPPSTPLLCLANNRQARPDASCVSLFVMSFVYVLRTPAVCLLSDRIITLIHLSDNLILKWKLNGMQTHMMCQLHLCRNWTCRYILCMFMWNYSVSLEYMKIQALVVDRWSFADLSV